ncbi:MAG TPA: hypothetical protein VJB93_01655 [Patescibacteria group bacterium]|nr:hypothetical protein [Patescibacteria group bacterium]
MNDLKEALTQRLMRIKELAQIAVGAGITGDPQRADDALTKIEAYYITISLMFSAFAEGEAKNALVNSAYIALMQARDGFRASLQKDAENKTKWRKRRSEKAQTRPASVTRIVGMR